jgi:multimeric flavodoxin WrbA
MKKSKKKVLVLLGSPRRKGNSSILAEKIAEGARSGGAEVAFVFLHDAGIEPCRGCGACQVRGSKGCVIDDGMQRLYPAMIEADAWVIASPVYWFTMSAQTKIWMDRCYAFPAYAEAPFAGKRIAIAMTYGGDDPFDSGCVNALRTFQDAYGYAGADIAGCVYGSAAKKGEIKKNRAAMAAAAELGKRLLSAEK